MTTKPTINNPKCPECEGAVFEIRVLKDEGIASAKCLNCPRDYLVLDSEDYWFDVIQAGYPRKQRCACKGEAFSIRCEYFFRATGDVKSIGVYGICAKCEKTKLLMELDIDYSPTENLIKRPLVFCKNPKILYDMKMLSFFITQADMALVAKHVSNSGSCNWMCNIRRGDAWVKESLRIDDVERVIMKDTFLYIYAHPTQEAISESAFASSSRRSEDAFWKRHEIIRFSSATQYGMGSARGLLYYINFSTEFVEQETVIQKSAQFKNRTNELLEWLPTKFVSWRGKYCFDSREEHIRIFGDRFHSE